MIEINPAVKLQKGKSYPLIDIDRIIPGIRSVCSKELITYQGQSGCKFQNGDTLMARITPCLENGKIAQAKIDADAGIGSTELFVFRNRKDKTDGKWVYYFISSPYVRLSAINSMTGASGRQRADKFFIERLKFDFPDLPTQEKIASILSAYDDAIENNNKRIKILEKMAENLYREWFVRMRFPGHKTAEYENGLPKGWKRGRLEDAIEVDPIVKIPKGEKIKSVPMAALSTSQMCIDENEISCSTTATGSRFSNGDVLLAKITPCLENGKTGFVNFLKENEYGCGSTEFIVLRARTLSPYFVYFLARSQYFRGIAIGSMNGADGRQRASASKIKQIKLICPTQDLVNKFSEVSKPFFDAIFKLSAMNHKLVKQRNRLLPHLLSGNLEIKI